MNRVWTCLAATLVAAVLAASPSPAAEAKSARLGGTVLQLWDEQRGWSLADWQSLFDDLKSLGLEDLVVQCVARGDVVFYSVERSGDPSPAALDTILDLAEGSGMKVWVGLSEDPDYWKKIRRDPELLEVYFKRRELASAAVLEALAPRITARKAFAGWYVSEEVDDVHWLEGPRREALVRYLVNLSSRVRVLTPDTKIAISGFSNAHADPRALAELWALLLARAPVDLVLFQDGIGVGKLETGELPVFLEAAHDAARGASRSLRVVVEVFRQTAGAPLDEAPFAAKPAPLEGLRAQLAVAARTSDGTPLGFGVPEYMTPRAGEKARELYEGYRRSLGK